MSPFTFTNSEGKDSAFAFLNVKPTTGKPYRIVACLPNYDPKDFSINPLPYRELFGTPESLDKPPFFRGAYQGFVNYGRAAWKVPGTNDNTGDLPKPMKLHWVIPEGASAQHHHTKVVGLAEVSDASTSNPLPGNVSLKVYRFHDIKLGNGGLKGIDEIYLAFVATSGPKPEEPKKK